VGSTFVIGAFDGKSAAEVVAAELRKMGGDMVVTLKKR
jgi:hypothetical protein